MATQNHVAPTMINRVRRNIAPRLTMIWFLVTSVHAIADDGFLGTGCAIGFGSGNTSTVGDISQQMRVGNFHLGIYSESNRWLFEFAGTADTGSEGRMSSFRMLLGGGWRHLKLSTGFWQQKSSMLTAPAIPIPQVGPLITTDTSTPTQISVTTVPVHMRLSPLLSKNVGIHLDGYYGLHTRGSLRVPVNVAGLAGYFDTEPVRAGGARGYGLTMDWAASRGRYGSLVVQISSSVGFGDMDRGSASISNDVLGLMTPQNVPDVEFKNRITMLSLVISPGRR